MHVTCRVFLGLCLTTACVLAASEDAPKVKLPKPEVVKPPADKATFHLFLLAGQSNMSGRGKPEAEDLKPHPRVLALNKAGQWVPAVAPIHFDYPGAGVCLAQTFARVLADEDPNVTIGLIPAACSGSAMYPWKDESKYHKATNSHPYRDAISRTKLAMKHGTLKGILWHQGEASGNKTGARVYLELLTNLIARFRKDLKAPGVPFVVGQLGQSGSWRNAYHDLVDAALKVVAHEDPRVGWVSSDGLTTRHDGIHFDAKSLRTLGERYAAAYKALVKAKAEK